MDGRLIGGRYRLLEARAIGGSSAVWRALDERTGRFVAVKRLHPHLAGDEHAIERLRREATVMGAVDHPNVVRVYDVGVAASGMLYVVMELAPAGSLEDARPSFGDRSFAVPILRQIADGLAALHAHGVIHRDLKSRRTMNPRGEPRGTDGVLSLPPAGSSPSRAGNRSSPH